MELTPERVSMSEGVRFSIAEDGEAHARPGKLKKPPPITPRRFTRFFTPRPRNARHAVRTSRTALQDITAPALNSRRLDVHLSSGDLSSFVDQPPRKKRRLSTTSPYSSLQSSPIKRADFPAGSQDFDQYSSPHQRRVPDPPTASPLCYIGEEDETDVEELESPRRSRILSYQSRSTAANLLYSRSSGRRAKQDPQNSNTWQQHAANFCTTSHDVYSSTNPGSVVFALPFCATSCNTNSLVATGNEDGFIQIIDSAESDRDGFSKTYLTMKPHDNAVMDLEFSSDDNLLATASGDQNCQVIDMQTQTSLYCLSAHTTSVKRIQFQPGTGNNVLATCARDGCINFWDLRCRTTDRPSYHLRSSGRADSDAMTNKMRFSPVLNSIRDAHAFSHSRLRQEARTKPIPIVGRSDFSVTSVAFLDTSRPHMLVSASESDAVVKLWDMRTTYNNRSKSRPAPVSCTQEPLSHAHHRRFGMTSLAMSGDGARLFALCRDHTVYTYASSHLVTGSSPEMSTQPSRPFRPKETSSYGLGPLYGFRHPQLRVSTFYPKLAVRKCNNVDTELLAVGSSDDCAMLFPTNERYLNKDTQIRPPPTQSASAARPRLQRNPSTVTSLNHHLAKIDFNDDISIYYHGTPLVRGHGKEVTAVSWTSEGSLVTASDDFTVRCWRENADRARQLRTKGEGEGARWGCGWADLPVGGDFDDDEG